MAPKRKSSRPPAPSTTTTEPPPAPAPATTLPPLTTASFWALRELVSGRPGTVDVSVREQLVADGWLTVDADAYLLTERARAFFRGPIDPSFYE